MSECEVGHGCSRWKRHSRGPQMRARSETASSRWDIGGSDRAESILVFCLYSSPSSSLTFAMLARPRLLSPLNISVIPPPISSISSTL